MEAPHWGFSHWLCLGFVHLMSSSFSLKFNWNLSHLKVSRIKVEFDWVEFGQGKITKGHKCQILPTNFQGRPDQINDQGWRWELAFLLILPPFEVYFPHFCVLLKLKYGPRENWSILQKNKYCYHSCNSGLAQTFRVTTNQ